MNEGDNESDDSDCLQGEEFDQLVWEDDDEEAEGVQEYQHAAAKEFQPDGKQENQFFEAGTGKDYQAEAGEDDQARGGEVYQSEKGKEQECLHGDDLGRGKWVEKEYQSVKEREDQHLKKFLERLKLNDTQQPQKDTAGKATYRKAKLIKDVDFRALYEGIKCQGACGNIVNPHKRFLCANSHMLCCNCAEERFQKFEATCMVKMTDEEVKKKEIVFPDGDKNLPIRAPEPDTCKEKLIRYAPDPIHCALYYGATWKCIKPGCLWEGKVADFDRHFKSGECGNTEVKK